MQRCEVSLEKSTTSAPRLSPPSADPRRYTPKGMPELPSSAASFRACSARAQGGSSSSSSASFYAAAAPNLSD